MSEKPLHYFDSRTAERNISRGLITREEYDAFVDGTEDAGDNSLEVYTRFVYSENAPEQQIVVDREDLKTLAEEHLAEHLERVQGSSEA